MHRDVPVGAGTGPRLHRARRRRHVRGRHCGSRRARRGARPRRARSVRTPLRPRHRLGHQHCRSRRDRARRGPVEHCAPLRARAGIVGRARVLRSRRYQAVARQAWRRERRARRGVVVACPERSGRAAAVTRVRLLFAAVAINLAFILAFAAMTRTPAGGPDVIDLQLAMSPGVFQQIVELWGPGTVAAVRRSIWVLDFLFPIAYAFLISRLYRSLCDTGGVTPYRAVLLAPWLAGAADYVENVLLLIMLDGAGPQPAAMVRAMSSAAIVKFVLLTIAGGFTLSALFKSDRGRVIMSARYSVISLLIG